MNIDLIIAAPLILALVTGRQRPGKQPAWAKRTEIIAIAATPLLILAGWVLIALGGTVGEWVMRLAFVPITVLAATSWIRPKL